MPRGIARANAWSLGGRLEVVKESMKSYEFTFVAHANVHPTDRSRRSRRCSISLRGTSAGEVIVRDAEARRAAGAAEPPDRRPPDVAAQAEQVDQARVDRRRGKAGGVHVDHAVDRLG